jgi:hypothetical protein
VLCSTWILVRQTGSHALADTKSRVPCSTADLDLVDSERDRFRLKGIAPSAARQTTSLMLSFGFNTPSNNKSHIPPFTRPHVASVEKKEHPQVFINKGLVITCICLSNLKFYLTTDISCI